MTRGAVWLLASLLLIASIVRADPPTHGGRERLDEALVHAAAIARLVDGFPNLRARHPLGVWRDDERARFSIRDSRTCLAQLSRLDISVTPLPRVRRHGLPIPTPVRVDSPIAGVRFRKEREGAPLIVSCEMAARMHTLATTLARHGVVEVEVLSAFRLEPRTSFHTMGLALDLHTFHRAEGDWVVARDWVMRPDEETCGRADALDTNASAQLRALACELARSGNYSTVLTPEYDADHFDHLHIDIRPDDARVFYR